MGIRRDIHFCIYIYIYLCIYIYIYIYVQNIWGYIGECPCPHLNFSFPEAALQRKLVFRSIFSTRSLY